MEEKVILRDLHKSDYHKKYLELTNQLSLVGNISEKQFESLIEERKKSNVHTWVGEKEGIIIVTISLILEKKIYRDGKYAGHIEDVIVHKNYRHLKLGTYIVNYALEQAKKHDCYKVILDCEENLHQFYAAMGFEHKNIQMAKYL